MVRATEVFHRILKSGCKAEDSMLRTADRLANLIAVFCVVSWRIFWLTMVHRATPRSFQLVAGFSRLPNLPEVLCGYDFRRFPP